MGIKVMYQDGKIEEIEPYKLDALIHSKTIKKFKRSGKWVTLGIDPIREVKEDYLEVPERIKFPTNTKKRK
jgi:hypothetical protein